MIHAIIFDLDGTLVQTEHLKALSYAAAAAQLSGGKISEQTVLEQFKEVVGLPRREVSIKLLNDLNLSEEAKSKLKKFDVIAPWQVFLQMRLYHYQKILENKQLIFDHACPYNIGLLKWGKEKGFRTGLATMSHCEQALKVLDILKLKHYFDFIATRDDVELGKPSPEIYLLVALELSYNPQECLVIEDSPAGIEAARLAGMKCIAITNDFTRINVHKSGLLDDQHIVDHLPDLQATVEKIILS